MPLHHERERTPREEEEGEEGNEFAERISIFSSSGFLFPSGHGGNGHSPAHSSSSPSLLSKSLPVEIPIFKLNSSPPYSTLHSTLRENGQSAGAPFLPSFHPSPVLSGSCPRPPTDRPTDRFLPSPFNRLSGETTAFTLFPSFVRSLFLSKFFSHFFQLRQMEGRQQTRASTSFFSSPSSLWATKSLHSTSFSSKGFPLVESGRGRGGGGGNPRT